VVADVESVVGAVAAGSPSACADVAVRLTVAMAAAAIASGAALTPEAGVAAVGVIVTAMATGIAVATGLGTGVGVPSGTAGVAESAVTPESDGDCAVDVAEPSSAVDFDRGR